MDDDKKTDDTNATLVIKDIKAALSAADREASERPPCLIVIGGDLNGMIFDLKLGVSTVGRSADNTISMDFQGISRNHFAINVGDNSTILKDLGSSNGTFVNNQKLEGPIILNRGDVIKMGNIALKYLPASDPERLTYDKLALEASTDGLTKCYNKMYFNNALETEFKKSKISNKSLALLIFDLDHFKNVNDNYGHDAGDFVLKEMANLIRKHGIRVGDVFARYGGEEFVILLPNTNLKQGFEIAERLRQLIEKFNFNYDSQKLPVTASIGISDYRSGVTSGVDLFKRADAAVYKSKQNGRNQVNFYK